MPADKPRAGVPRSEWEIMKVLWAGGPMALGDIHSRLSAHYRWAYSTTKTLVRRLVEKGWVAYERVGNSFLYRAAVPRSEAVRHEIRQFSERVLDGLLSPLVAYHAERGDLSPEDIEKLEEILEQYRSKGASADDTGMGTPGQDG